MGDDNTRLFDKLDDLSKIVAEILGKLKEKEKACDLHRETLYSLAARVGKLEEKMNSFCGAGWFLRNLIPVSVSIAAVAVAFFK